MIVLLYRAERISGWTDEKINDYEMAVSNYFKKYIYFLLSLNITLSLIHKI